MCHLKPYFVYIKYFILLQECEYNPKKPVSCEDGCGLVIPKDELKVIKQFILCFF